MIPVESKTVYTYNPNSTIEQDLKFPGVMFTLGSPVIHRDGSNESPSCTVSTTGMTEKEYKLNESITIPVNMVFNYISNAYDFGKIDLGHVNGVFPNDDHIKKMYYSYALRRYIGDIYGMTSHPGVSGYGYTNYYDAYKNGSNASTSGSLTLTEIINGVYEDRVSLFSDITVPGAYQTFLNIKSITFSTDVPLNFTVKITPAITAGNTNPTEITRRVNTTSSNLHVTANLSYNNCALVTASTLYDRLNNGNTYYKNHSYFYSKSNDNSDNTLYNSLVSVSNYYDINYYKKNYTQYTDGVNSSSSNNFFFSNLLTDPTNIPYNKRIITSGHSSSGGSGMCVIPLSNEFQSKTYRNKIKPSIHLFANTFTITRPAIDYEDNTFAKIEIVIDGVSGYEESVHKEGTINIENIELDVRSISLASKKDIEPNEAKASVLIIGSYGDVSGEDKKTSLYYLRELYSQASTFLEHNPDYLNNDLDPRTLGYGMATISSTLQDINEVQSEYELPFNSNMYKNVTILGNGVKLTRMKTADPTIWIDHNSLKIDGYAPKDLNGFVKNTLSSNKHTISFKISYPTESVDTISGLPYPDVIFGVKLYNSYDTAGTNSSIPIHGRYVSLPTDVRITNDNQSVSYLLNIDSSYINKSYNTLNGSSKYPAVKIDPHSPGITVAINDIEMTRLFNSNDRWHDGENIDYYILKRGSSASVTIYLSDVKDIDIATKHLARVFDIGITAVNAEYKEDQIDSLGHQTRPKEEEKYRYYTSQISSDELSYNGNINPVGGFGTMFIQEGLPKNTETPYSFYDSIITDPSTPIDIVNVGDEIAKSPTNTPIPESQKLVLNSRDLSIVTLPPALVNYINEGSVNQLGTFQNTHKMKEEYYTKHYIYEYDDVDGLCLTDDMLLIDFSGGQNIGTYKCTASFLAEGVSGTLDNMHITPAGHTAS